MQREQKLLRLSQAQLNSLEKCPRLFQHRHIEQIYSFTNPEQEAKQALGSKFHLLMQQREMGLPIAEILADDLRLSAWVEDFGKVAPDVFTPNSNSQLFRESEHYRTLQIDEYLFTVIYDLLILNTNQAQIIDWKTYPQPPSKRWLENSWQTRLYLYVLAQTTNYPPEEITMTYWFFQTGTKPTSTTIKYSRSLHEQIQQKLQRLLTKLTQYLREYDQDEQNQFPQIEFGSKLCQECAFARRCDRALSSHQYTAIASSHENEQSPTGFHAITSLIDDSLLDSDAVEEVTPF